MDHEPFAFISEGFAKLAVICVISTLRGHATAKNKLSLNQHPCEDHRAICVNAVI
jgi:hypothetical protein